MNVAKMRPCLSGCQFAIDVGMPEYSCAGQYCRHYQQPEEAINKKRYNRIAQAKHRGSKRSYRTELENAQIMLAWLAEELSEGQAAHALGVDRISLRVMRDGAIAQGLQLAEALR